MQLINLDNQKEKLDEFLKQNQGSFLHSYAWGEFQSQIGNNIFRFGVLENEKLVFAVTLIKKNLPIKKSYFYLPTFQISEERSKFLFEEIAKLAKQEDCIFLRVDPVGKFDFEKSDFKTEKTIDIQPRKTVILDLEKSEEDLLAGMKQKTRYNIRLAEKKGVRVRKGDKKDFEKFWELMRETNERDGFRPHVKSYYERMLELPNIEIFLAEFDNKILAGGIFSFFSNTATYLHGASSNEMRNLMAPYALQWEVIRFAKERGFGYYDFYGIDEEKWPGVTRFKLGFSEKIVENPGTYDIIFNNSWYFIYKIIRKINRIRRK